MFTVEEVSRDLTISKVTIYKKLKKYEDKVVLKQGKKYITEELLDLIKKELTVKREVKNEVKNDDIENLSNQEIAIDIEGSIKLKDKLNERLTDILLKQLKEKDIQLKEKDNQISELQKLLNQSQRLIENNQVLLKQQQDKEINQIMLEDHFKEGDEKLADLKNKMDKKRKKYKSIFSFFLREELFLEKILNV